MLEDAIKIIVASVRLDGQSQELATLHFGCNPGESPEYGRQTARSALASNGGAWSKLGVWDYHVGI